MQSPKSVSKKWMKLQSAAIARSPNPLKISLWIRNWAKNIFKIHSLCGRSKKGRGEVGGRKGKGKGALPLFPIPLPFFPSSLSPIPYPFRRLLRRLQNPPIRWPIHLPPYGRFECKHSKKESQLGRGKPVWYILEKHVWAGLNVDFFNQEQIKQNGHGWNWT